MKDLLQNVNDLDYVEFNKHFKNKLKEKFNVGVDEIKTEVNKKIFETVKINDDQDVVKCKNCGKVLEPGIPLIGSCPYCGDLLV